MATPEKTRVIHSGNTRTAIYVGAAIVAAGAVAATLISLGLLSHEQIDAWMQSVVTIVTGIVSTGALILAALNRAPSESTGRRVEPEPEPGSVDFARHVDE